MMMVVSMDRTQFTLSWSVTPPPLLSSSSSELIRHCKSVLISSSILISCQLGSLPRHDIAFAAALPVEIAAATVPPRLSYASTLLSSLAESTTNSNTNTNTNINTDDNSNNIDFQKLQQSLSNPTDDRPQIKLPPDSTNGNYNTNTNPNTSNQSNNNFNNKNMQNKNEPLIQGMVYLLNQNDRPDFSDTIVLTVASTSNPDVPIAGAKYSVSKARFPFQFRLYRANILLDDQRMERNIENQDLMVTARICPTIATPTPTQDTKAAKVRNTKNAPASRIPCEVDESTFLAKGISKVVGNLPGMTEGTVFRTAASLPLERRR